jgi:hypothetical protein
MSRGARFQGVPKAPQAAPEIAERMFAHQEAIAAYNKAQRALNEAQNLVAYLEAEVERTLAACQSFMPPKEPS